MTNRTLIVARLARGGAETAVAELFGASDRTRLPLDLGVVRRDLYRFHDLYFHHIEFRADPHEAITRAGRRDDFRALSEELRPHVTAYDPATWRSPADATATCFYSWQSPDGGAAP